LNRPLNRTLIIGKPDAVERGFLERSCRRCTRSRRAGPRRGRGRRQSRRRTGRGGGRRVGDSG